MAVNIFEKVDFIIDVEIKALTEKLIDEKITHRKIKTITKTNTRN